MIDSNYKWLKGIACNYGCPILDQAKPYPELTVEILAVETNLHKKTTVLMMELEGRPTEALPLNRGALDNQSIMLFLLPYVGRKKLPSLANNIFSHK